MAFGGQMRDHIGPEAGDRRLHGRAVADVGPNEAVARAVRDRRQGGQVAGIGQHVEVQHLVIRLADQVANQGRADKACPSGDEDAHGCAF